MSLMPASSTPGRTCITPRAPPSSKLTAALSREPAETHPIPKQTHHLKPNPLDQRAAISERGYADIDDRGLYRTSKLWLFRRATCSPVPRPSASWARTTASKQRESPGLKAGCELYGVKRGWVSELAPTSRKEREKWSTRIVETFG